MNSLMRLVRRLHSDESGATATEYLIILTLVACFVIAVVQTFGETVENKYADATNGVNRLVVF